MARASDSKHGTEIVWELSHQIPHKFWRVNLALPFVSFFPGATDCVIQGSSEHQAMQLNKALSSGGTEYLFTHDSNMSDDNLEAWPQGSPMP